MNAVSPITAPDLRSLQGSVVLVTSAEDRRNPSTGVRGWIDVVDRGPNQSPAVQVVLEFPQMFTVRAHRRTVTLTEQQVATMVAHERNGTFELVLPERLDPEAPPGNE